MAEKVAGIVGNIVTDLQGGRSGGRRGMAGFSVLRERARQRMNRTDDWGSLAAELELFEPLDGFALVGDDLCLPHERNGHEAHADDAKYQNKSNLRLLGGKVKDAAKPGHGKGSPSTRLSQSIDPLPFRFDRLRGHLDLPSENVAIGRP